MPATPTVYLGQFTDENAAAIGELLDRAEIVWWAKSSGRLTRMVFAGDWGTRLFVEASRKAEAIELAQRVTGERPQ